MRTLLLTLLLALACEAAPAPLPRAGRRPDPRKPWVGTWRCRDTGFTVVFFPCGKYQSNNDYGATFVGTWEPRSEGVRVRERHLSYLYDPGDHWVIWNFRAKALDRVSP